MFGGIGAAITGGVASGLGGLFGDQSGAFGDASAAFRELAQRYNPYVDRGNKAGDLGMAEYQKLISNPNFLQDMVAKGFFESPYQKELLGRTTDAMNINAANTGMIQSPVAQRALNDQVNNMTGQFMDNYISRGMGSYGQGLSGLQGMNQMGLSALGQQDAALEQAIGADLKGAQSSEGNIMNTIGNFAGVGMNYFNGQGLMKMLSNKAPYQGAFGASGVPYANPASSSFNLGF